MHNKTERTKYKYAPLENGAFYFPTDDGFNFVVEIEKSGYKLWQSDYLLNYDNIFSIEFERSADVGINLTSYDKSTCDTILKIISSKIESNGECCVYYHHWVDDSFRDELYDTFYDELEGVIPEYEGFEFPWVDENGEDRITSVFVNKTNSDKAIIVYEFKTAVGCE